MRRGDPRIASFALKIGLHLRRLAALNADVAVGFLPVTPGVEIGLPGHLVLAAAEAALPWIANFHPAGTPQKRMGQGDCD
jgi:hypothetical protein